MISAYWSHLETGRGLEGSFKTSELVEEVGAGHWFYCTGKVLGFMDLAKDGRMRTHVKFSPYEAVELREFLIEMGGFLTGRAL